MKRATLFAAAFLTVLAGLGVLRARLQEEHLGTGAGAGSREVLKVGYLPVT